MTQPSYKVIMEEVTQIRPEELIDIVCSYLTLIDTLLLRRLAIRLSSGRVLMHDDPCFREGKPQYWSDKCHENNIPPRVDMLKLSSYERIGNKVPQVLTLFISTRKKRIPEVSNTDYLGKQDEFLNRLHCSDKGQKTFVSLVDAETGKVLTRDIGGFPGSHYCRTDFVDPTISRAIISLVEVDSVNECSGRLILRSVHLECRECKYHCKIDPFDEKFHEIYYLERQFFKGQSIPMRLGPAVYTEA